MSGSPEQYAREVLRDLEAAVKDTLAEVIAKLPAIAVFHGPAPAEPSREPLRLR